LRHCQPRPALLSRLSRREQSCCSKVRYSLRCCAFRAERPQSARRRRDDHVRRALSGSSWRRHACREWAADDPGIIRIGTSYLRIVGPIYSLYGLGMGLYFAHPGLQQSRVNGDRQRRPPPRQRCVRFDCRLVARSGTAWAVRFDCGRILRLAALTLLAMLRALVLSVAEAIAIFRFKVRMIQFLAASCAAGMALYLAGRDRARRQRVGAWIGAASESG
jgi:hypothetical protein